MQQKMKVGMSYPTRALAAVLAAVCVTPALPAHSQSTPLPKVTTQASTPKTASKVAQVTMLDQLRALRDSAQAALTRAEESATTATTSTTPQQAGVKPDPVLEQLRLARDAAQAALDAQIALDAQVSKEAFKRAMQNSKIPADEQVKASPEQQRQIAALQLQSESFNKELADLRQQVSETKIQDRLSEGAKLQQKSKELSQKATAQTQSVNQTVDWANWVLSQKSKSSAKGSSSSKPKSSAKDSSFQLQPRLNGPAGFRQYGVAMLVHTAPQLRLA